MVWQHEIMQSAITREKAIKKWMRSWKLKLIEKANPEWLDLYPFITGEALDSRLRGNDGSLQAAMDTPTQAQAANSVIQANAYAVPALADSGIYSPSVLSAPSVIPALPVLPVLPVSPAQAGIQKDAS